MVRALIAFGHVLLQWLRQLQRLRGEPAVWRRQLPDQRGFRALGVLLGLSVFCLESSAWQPPEAVSVQARRQGTAVYIEMQAAVKAPLDVIWNTLTDYNRLAEFIPGMASSRIVEKRGNILIVEQSGTARLWLFSYAIDVVVKVTEQRPHAISVNVISGNLKQLEGGYQLQPLGDGSGNHLLTWTGVIEPALPAPIAMTLPLIRNSLSQQFEGMVHEIERREARRVSLIQR
jgi:ribosome-associated toxin RatA of RatAB toxin-antitoxin module